MKALLPDFLRAVISTTANVFLMMTLLQPKYSQKITRLTMLAILAADLGTAVYCYLAGNLTMLARIDTVLFFVLCFAVRPLFKDTFMQWLFSYLTVQTISDMVVILSFLGSRWMPWPAYGNCLLRLVLFGGFYVLLSRYVRPLYRQAVKHWTAYFAVALGLYVTFTYYTLTADNIVVMLTEQAVPLLLVIFIGFAAYGSIFLSLKNLQREYALREENRRMQSDREYLSLSAKAMTQRLTLMNEAARKNSLAAHDRRHFNNTVLELLEQGKADKAKALLQKQAQTQTVKPRSYCENPAVNAAVCWYAAMAEEAGIRCDIALDIPQALDVDELELSVAVSNLMENAIHGCQALPEDGEKFLRFTCRCAGRLLLELENPCVDHVTLDEEGLPHTAEAGHGVGCRSVAAFVQKYGGELLYHVESGVFRVRLIV